MTVIGKNLYSETMDPKHRYRPSKCSRCGAATLDEAAEACRPTQGHDGEYTCPGGDENVLNPFALKWDSNGNACELTVACAKQEAVALDAWCREESEGGAA